ncbi:unnamed protein product [Durusdinium trenchii]|uniref:Uncharacterized protein n=1 Tax=Durusdinium trenchii TaxID=1381693 RepID=A0ABP0RY51_9DINO
MDEAPSLPSLRSARLLLAQQKAFAADLERRLSAIQARLIEVPIDAVEECSQREESRHQRLAEALCLSEQEAAEAAAERDLLRQELQEANRAVATTPQAAQLAQELRDAELAQRCWCEELQEVRQLQAGLESSLSQCKEEASSEAAESQRLRKCLEERGCGLSWLRGIARSHVEDLQGSVTSLDNHLHPALQASLGSDGG